MDIKKAFGEVLRELRQKRNLSQEKLALGCNLDRTYISLLERGLRQPSLITLFELAKFLDTTPVKLVGAVQDKINNKK